MRQRKVYPPKPEVGQDHPYVRMKVPTKRRYAEVDQLMAPIVKRCWELGIGTKFCCQGDYHHLPLTINSTKDEVGEYFNHTAYIMFSSMVACRWFVHILQPERIIWKGFFNYEYDRSQIALQFNEQWCVWEQEFDVVRFPHSEIAGVSEALDNWKHPL